MSFKKIWRKFFPKSGNKIFKQKVLKFQRKYSHTTKKSPKLLIWEFGGMPGLLTKDLIIALSMQVRGYMPHCVFCDGTTKACILREINSGESYENWGKTCSECCQKMVDVANNYNIEYSTTSDYINSNKYEELKKISMTVDLKDINDFQYMGVNIGEITWSSINRYMKGGLIELTDFMRDYEIIYREYFLAALVNTYVAKVVIEKIKPKILFQSHGHYVDYAPAIFVSAANNVNTFHWMTGFKDYHHFICYSSSPENYLFIGFTDKIWQERVNKPLTDKENQILDNYIYERYLNTYENKTTDIVFKPKLIEESELKNKLGIYNNHPIVTLFAHLNWDSCINPSKMLFENVNKWIINSIEEMVEIKDVNWLIKIHPWEYKEGTYLGVNEIINNHFGKLPEHIKILDASVDLNPYNIYNLSDIGITFSGTTGVEMALLGKPIVSCGESHFVGKGFSTDPKSKDEYFKILNNIRDINPLTPSQIEMARQYAFAFMIQIQIPFNMINNNEGHYGNIDINKLEDLLPSKDSFIDKACNCMIKGKEIILSEEDIVFSEKEEEILNART